MFDQLLVFAQDATRFDQAQTGFRWCLTVVGIGVLMIGVGLIFSKDKDPQKATSPAIRWATSAIAALIGVGIIGYAWLVF